MSSGEEHDEKPTTTQEPAKEEAQEPRRRIRRSQRLDVPEEAASATEEEAPPAERAEASSVEARPAEARPAEARPAAARSGEGRPRREPRPAAQSTRGPRRPEQRPRPRGRPDQRPPRKEARQAGDAPPRTIYRQDTHGSRNGGAQARGPAVAPPPAPEPPKPAAAADKITLILHPAPKAAPTRKKKESRPLTPKEALKARLAKRGKPGKQASDGMPTSIELSPEWLEATGAAATDAIQAAAEGGEALVKAWLDRSNVDALARAASHDSLIGRVRKAARRALNVLRSRGIEIPDVQPAAAVRPQSGAEARAEAPVASFVPPDAVGTAFFSISQRQPGGRFFVADVLIRPDVGVVHASSGRIAGKHIRRWKNRVTERFGTAPVEVPLAWARQRIAEGRKLNESSGQVLPLGFDSCAVMFEPVPDAPEKHPTSDLEPSDADVSKAAGDSDVLHNEPEFRSWVPDRRAVDELLMKVGERVGGDGGQDPSVVDEALRVEIAAATDRYFSPERRALLADLMRDSAISIRRRSDDTARRALAVARAVREAGLITSPPSEIPFLVSFFRKAVAILVQRGQGKLEVPVPRGEVGA
ncbi:MAG TPA: hypothetical protein VFB62_12985 [Polyangiaceae bacterium]|jgi:hypothetical protein|nr:hypothetical protein [Polyangiaceae bacterium]